MFQHVTPLPPDPLLGISIAFAQDNNPKKVDLGVGMYKDESGTTPIFDAVKRAEEKLIQSQGSKSYIGSAGSTQYNELMMELVFGSHHSALMEQRIATVQTPGGCGALRVAAEFIKRCRPDTTIWVSDPTWPNHEPLLGDAGLKLATYPYYDQATHSILFDEMMKRLETIPAHDVVLLHGCCHNPSGADLSREQWNAINELALRKGFLVFIDLAYQGFGDGVDEDAYGVRLMSETLPELVVANSCSKNFGIYRERTGTLCIVTQANETAPAVQSHLNKIVRGIYSMPPAHGAAIVETLLADKELKKEWLVELELVRNRIKDLRKILSDKIQAYIGNDDYRFIEKQQGMFSFLSLSSQQVERLRVDFSIYVAGSSRANIAGLTLDNIDYVAKAIADVATNNG
ncbi:MAG: aspartate/tyrosine/aromatic aminotransferase [Cellvibrionaceae bacterium]